MQNDVDLIITTTPPVRAASCGQIRSARGTRPIAEGLHHIRSVGRGQFNTAKADLCKCVTRALVSPSWALQGFRD